MITKNKTWFYLTPIIDYLYGKELSRKIGQYILKVGIGDSCLGDTYFKHHIFILIKNSYCLEWIREQDYYEYDYSITDLSSDEVVNYVVIIKLPETYATVIQMFTEGKFSKMFTHSEVEDIYKTSNQDVKDVLLLNIQGQSENFKKKLMKEFNIRRDEPEITWFPEKIEELDFINKKEEFVN